MPVGGSVNQGPEPWGVSGDLTVDFAKKAIGLGATQITWVGDADFVARGQSLGQMVGGGIVAVAEASGKNENACFVHVTLEYEGSDAQALRRCSFRVRIN